MILQIIEENGEPIIKLVGSQLSKMGYNIGDIVHVSFSKNQIVIRKNKDTIKIQKIASKNPSLKQLIEDFNLDLLIA